MQTTLVLDSGMQPINIVPWQRAASYITRDVCSVLEEYDSQVHVDMQMPAVVRLNRSVARGKRRVKFSRANVLMRDRNRCQYCGQPFPPQQLTFEHVIPRCQGGKTEWSNIVMACWPCNDAKGGRTPAQADMRLLRRPERPSYVPWYNPKLRAKEVPPEWMGYWTVELEP